jgi:signal peptidase I
VAAVRRRRRTERRREPWWALLSDLTPVGICLLLLHLFVFNLSLVRGSSMRPNIEDGDRLLVDRLAYSLADVQRYDVVILQCPRDPRVDYVKRVVGLPGDVVAIRHGDIFVNGEPVPEPFACIPDATISGRWIVPEDHYFVLGDNRPVSSDSREGWYVSRPAIRGKVRACFWPIDRLQAFW